MVRPGFILIIRYKRFVIMSNYRSKVYKKIIYYKIQDGADNTKNKAWKLTKCKKFK